MLRPLGLATVLALASALAGCSGPGSGDPEAEPSASTAAGPGAPGGGGTGPLELGPPAWQVGDHWDHHWYIPDGAGGEFDFRFTAIVVEESAAGWRLAAGDLQTAIFHAAFYFPDLGVMGADGTVRAPGLAYPWYDFPLTDGKAWTAEETNLDFNLEPVERTLRFRAAWVEPEGGVPGHYAIEAREDGNLRARYDYRPDLGWFSEYRAYGGEEAEPANHTFRIQAETAGHAYRGPWFEAVAEPLLEHVQATAPAAGAVATEPVASFAMDGGMTHLFAIQFSFAAGGFHDTELVAPDGTRYGYQAFEANGAAFSDGQDTLVVPAQAGEWHVTTVGAGAFAAGGGVLAWGATVTESSL